MQLKCHEANREMNLILRFLDYLQWELQKCINLCNSSHRSIKKLHNGWIVTLLFCLAFISFGALLFVSYSFLCVYETVKSFELLFSFVICWVFSLCKVNFPQIKQIFWIWLLKIIFLYKVLKCGPWWSPWDTPTKYKHFPCIKYWRLSRHYFASFIFM